MKAKDLSMLYTSIINKEHEIFEEEIGRLLMETISFCEKDCYVKLEKN